MEIVLRKCLAAVLLAILVHGSVQAAENPDSSSFVIESIRILGNRRISEGTVLNYLPIQAGDSVDRERLRSALRNIYRAGFFEDVEFRRDGNVLIIIVEERPSIRNFNLSGNEEIETEELERILRSQGLAEGRVLDRSALEIMKQELTRQYHSRGKYGVNVDAIIDDVGNNQVDVSVVISEGRVAKIREFTITGNRIFSDKKLKKNLELSETKLFSWATGNDKYAREKLVGDFETLRSYYMDRGYADFKIKSAQVSVTPDRRRVYINIGVHEGEIYTIKDTQLVGEMVIPQEELERFILVQPGTIFNMALATASADFIVRRLNAEGYAFAEAQPIPELDRDTKEVSFTFFVDPGDRAYVSRITFKTSSGTNDEVFRREMRQFEGAWLSSTNLDRSKLRIQRLPFVEGVEIETNRIAGSPDLVDVEVDIEERSAGNFIFGVGFGGSSTGLFLNTSVAHANFLGTGQRVSFSAQKSEFSKLFSISHTQPYATVNGISRRLSLSYSESDRLGRDLESFSIENIGLGVTYGFPVAEFTRVSFGANPQKAQLITSPFSGSSSTLEFVSNPNHGDVFETFNFNNQVTGIGVETNILELTAGWGRDTRNRTLFADRGSQSTVGLTVGVPPGDSRYYTVSYAQRNLFPLGGGWTIATNGNIAFADFYGNSTEIPPSKKLFAGGTDSIRAFRDNFLGPRDDEVFIVSTSTGDIVRIPNPNVGQRTPIGGSFRTFLQAELFLPNFFADDPMAPPKTGRFSLFLDFGNSFRDFDSFKTSEFRASYGVAAQFLTPVGAIRISYGIPLRDKEFDDIERLQFTVGTIF